MKVTILYGEMFNCEYQQKSFKDEVKAIEWCRRHADKIGSINGYATGFQPVSHFEIMDALRHPF